MKTKQIINAFLILFFLSGLTKVEAQNDKDPYSYCLNPDGAKQLFTAFKEMHKNAKVQNFKDDKTCKVKDLIAIEKNRKYKMVSERDAAAIINGLVTKLGVDKTKEKLDIGFLNKTDNALQAYSKSKSFIDFVKRYTGKGVGDIKGEWKDPSGMVYKDIDQLRRHYNKLKRLFTKDIFSVDIYNEVKNNCRVKRESSFKVLKYSFPKVTWQLKTTVTIKCVCQNGNDNTEIKSGSYEYIATSKGLYSSSKITFSKPIDSKINVLSLECCGYKSPVEDSSYIDPMPMPDQTIGYSAGLGFQNDFEEISYCFGAEYLKRISNKKCDTYLGGGISYEGTSFDGNTTNLLMGGPKIQWHTPINQNGDTQWVNGFKGNYMIGNQKNGDYKDKLSGIQAGIYSGFNIQLNEKTSVGIEIPVFTWEKIKIKPEMGTDYEFDGTSLLLNKGNPAKINFRFRF
jgi:hypothetical protein